MLCCPWSLCHETSFHITCFTDHLSSAIPHAFILLTTIIRYNSVLPLSTNITNLAHFSWSPHYFSSNLLCGFIWSLHLLYTSLQSFSILMSSFLSNCISQRFHSFSLHLLLLSLTPLYPSLLGTHNDLIAAL